MKPAFLNIFLCITIAAVAQPDTTIKNLIFEGAGIRGIAYCGAISALEENNLIQNIQRVGGTSAGAITALTVSLGYNSSDIAGILSNTSFNKFNDGRFIFFGGINRLNKYYGWYKGQRIEKWIADIIENKTGDPDITFRQLKEKGFKDLYITGTSLTKQQAVVFSHETYPDMKVKDAVRISVSIPLYFEAIFINYKGEIFHHPKNKQNLEVMADGGFIANFPVRLFDSTKYADPMSQNQFEINRHTLAFRIDNDLQIINDTSNRQLAAVRIGNFKDYINAFYTMIIENLNRQTLTDDDWKRTVSISDGKIAPRIRKLSHDELHTLISNGKTATSEYLRR